MAPLAVAALCVGQITSRDVRQDGGSWIITYRLASDAGPDLRVHAEGDVSCSRGPQPPGRNPHAVPLYSSAAACPGQPGSCQILPDSDALRGGCRERLRVTADGPAVTARFDHDHAVVGAHDPLLGVRTVTVRSGGREWRDTLDLTRETRRPSSGPWPDPIGCTLDTTFYRTAPHAIHLNAAEAGESYCRLPERPVRYGTRFRLRFWYCIARGGDPGAEYTARVCQYRDTEREWSVLSECAVETRLRAVGRWTRVERVFVTHPECTTAAVELKISSEVECGEMWVDDLSLEEVGAQKPQGP